MRKQTVPLEEEEEVLYLSGSFPPEDEKLRLQPSAVLSSSG